MPNTTSGRTFERFIEAGLKSLGMEKVSDNELFTSMIADPTLCRNPSYKSQYRILDEQKQSGKQHLDFAICIPIRRPLAGYALSRKGRRLLIGIECRYQNCQGSIDKKNWKALDDLADWRTWIPHARLVLGGQYWNGDNILLRQLQHECGRREAKNRTMRVVVVQQFAEELSKIMGAKWAVTDHQLAVLEGKIDPRQRALFAVGSR